MKEDIKTYSDGAYEMIVDVSENIGSRLPGSPEEKKFARLMADKISELGLKPVTERFMVAPRASIGGIPYIGWAGIIASLTLYFGMFSIIGFLLCAAAWIFLVVQVILYKGWFDAFFHQEISHNVYTELLPKDGKYDYTIMLSAHMDTSWNWKHSAVNPITMFIKVGLGAVAMIVVTLATAAMFVTTLLIQHYAVLGIAYAELFTEGFIEFVSIFNVVAYFIPVVTIPLMYFITMWRDKNASVASPGAMDNLTGIAINYYITKYYKENPDKMPKNCRIIDLNCGSEEAGLKGSLAFIKAHKGEDILKNVYSLNVDSIADKDYFQCIIGDSWQFTRFDKGLENIFMESMKECGIEKPGCIKNPVGGCDSTPFCKAGIRTITFSAQNPIATNYYHTFRDTADRFEPETVQKGMEVMLTAIDKIAAQENAKKK
jgi:hypothetical protein